MSEGSGGDVDRCLALTNAGTRCTRPAGDDGFCYQHDASSETVDRPAATGEPSADRSDADGAPSAEPSADRSAGDGVPAVGASSEASQQEPASVADEPDDRFEEPVDRIGGGVDRGEEPVDRTGDLSPVEGELDEEPAAAGAPDERPEPGSAGTDDRGDLAERLQDRTRQQYDEGARLLREGRDAAEERGRAGLDALETWYASRLVPALRSAREALRRRWSRLADGRSTDRK